MSRNPYTFISLTGRELFIKASMAFISKIGEGDHRK